MYERKKVEIRSKLSLQLKIRQYNVVKNTVHMMLTATIPEFSKIWYSQLRDRNLLIASYVRSCTISAKHVLTIAFYDHNAIFYYN